MSTSMSESMSMSPALAPLVTVGAVVLSMGDRPTELAKALSTLQAQEGVELDILVVGNGWDPTDLPDGIRTLYLPENVGIPEGRNVGAAAVRGEFIFFYDDDAFLPRTDVVARLAAFLVADPTLAIAQPRGMDPGGKLAPKRWTPRVGGRRPEEPGLVPVFWEGVHLSRRSAFEQVGGWPGFFWYGHEGIDLAFRLIDAGWQIRYCPEVVVNHPATTAKRHAVFYRMNARNRVWVARRNLPAPLVPAYLGSWIAITLLRERDPEGLRTWFAGFKEGMATDAGERHPMAWRTVWRLTQAGRPPIV